MSEQRIPYIAATPTQPIVDVAYTDLSRAVLKLARIIDHKCAAVGSYVIELERGAYAKDAIDVTISRVDRVDVLKIDKDGQRQ